MRVIYTSWLALPLAILTAPILAALFSLLANVPVENFTGRLSQQILLIALTTSFVVLVDVVRPLSKVTIQNVAYGSLISALIWALGSIDGALWTGFWDVASSSALWKRSAALIVPFLAVGLLRGRRPYIIATTIQALIAILVAAFFIDSLFPQYSRPTFSVRDESRALASVFPAGAGIYSRHANSLFLENELRYREGGFVESGPPAGVVVFEYRAADCCGQSFAAFGHSYRLKYRHNLQFDPRYFAAVSFDRSLGPGTLAVYELEKPEPDR